mmetsp:Transcript_1908/g.6053  ORF Transcript_1908/g.6053 Transcript_1908/m.6053 type:complete len:215 (-) Transcript_1908:64-708(-)
MTTCSFSVAGLEEASDDEASLPAGERRVLELGAASLLPTATFSRAPAQYHLCGSENVLVPPGSEEEELLLSSLKVVQMCPENLVQWYAYLDEHKLTSSLHRFWDGRRCLRYIANNAYQYHFGCVMLYMHVLGLDDISLSAEHLGELRRRDFKRARDEFAHGKPRTVILGKDDFELAMWLVYENLHLFVSTMAGKPTSELACCRDAEQVCLNHRL